MAAVGVPHCCTLSQILSPTMTQWPYRGVTLAVSVQGKAYEIASALSYLHAHDVVHGDLSAWNVLLSSVGAGADPYDKRGFVVKVADFGLARSLDVEQHVKTRNYGTLTHQPPETLSHGLVSRETDTYSLGVLMWQMYTGSRPWAGMTQSQIKGSVTSGSSQLKWPPHTPPDFLALASACLSFKPTDRPSMSHVCSTLDALRNKHQLATP
ncbi:hypothetical protein QJQ45_010107 [Haematococcus lacustris]|nr:hypothetical protein QJQ45_010107 [Haematococcus lacustris]